MAAALLLQSLYPSGYMPASLADGWVAMLCPEGLPAGFVQQLADNNGTGQHHAHHHDSDTGGSSHADDMSVDYCPLGSGIDQPVTLATTVASVDVADNSPLTAESEPWQVIYAPRRSSLARAPPAS